MSGPAVAFESRYQVAKTLALDLRIEPRHSDSPAARQLRRMALTSIPLADPFYWSSHIASAVLQSAKSLPADTTITVDGLPGSVMVDGLPGSNGWMWFEKPWPPGVFTKHVHVHALHWFVMESWLVVMPIGGDANDSPSHILDTGCAAAMLGTPISEMKNGAIETAIMSFWVASTLWLQQRVLVADRVKADRASRRRAGIAADDSRGWLNVVNLRRAERHDGTTDAEADDGRYACQWVVRGHWRQQFYPSTNERRPLWIMPYVKGPEDAPLKAPRSTVFAVTR